MITKDRLINFIRNGNTLYIKLQTSLTCVQWGCFWGEVDSIIEADSRKHLYSNIVLVFEKCYYADPMALMSVILDLVRIKNTTNREIIIVLPHLLKNDIANTNFIKGQFLKFLATQGFLNIMCEKFVVRNWKAFVDRNVLNKYANYKYELPYCGEVLFPMHVYECSDESEKEEIVRDVIETILFRFRNTVSVQTYKKMSEQIYNIVNELVENAIKHAYAVGEKKLFSLYIRRRQGISSENEDAPGRDIIEKEMKKERVECPASDTRIYVENTAFLEIYFSDVGMGLKNSLKEYFLSLKKEYNYPVRELFRKVLVDGVRRNSSNSNTPFGGLHFICRIIGENRGYIWCNEGKEWVGASSIELINSAVKNDVGEITDNQYKKYTRGLNWCFRIPYDSSVRKNGIAHVWKKGYDTHPIYNAYQERVAGRTSTNVICIDERYEKAVFINGDYKDWKECCLNEIWKLPIVKKGVTCVWIPKGNYTKNGISNKIREYIIQIQKIISNEEVEINLIIGDINSDSLFSYYYALNGVKAESVGIGIINRYILVSRKWETVCFNKKNGILVHNVRDEEKYYLNKDSNAFIYESIVQYALFIRNYDSYLFWSMIKVHYSDKIYISADIEWGNNQRINGYLDLERAYLYEDLYSIVENALMRTVGFVNSAGVEFCSIDQTASRVCQNINANNSIEDENFVLVNVCGACVTGYTYIAYYKDNRPSFNIILFAHPDYQQKMRDAAYLFLWPEKDFFCDLLPEKEIYYRLGKTSLITKRKNESLINTEKIYDGVARNQKEKYTDLQMESPRIIKYGHYKTDNHHYLLGFDFLTYMKYSYLKKQGAFLFFLWKVAYYLYGEDLTTLYDAMTNQDWKNALKNSKFKKDSNHGEIVVYHSNTVTEYIMKMVKELLPDEISDKIIPVYIYEIQAKGSPVTFSPFAMERIESYFVDREKRGVLFVDSTYSTGRKMLEIENVLLSTGCKKVSFLSIVDMRRLRNNDAKNVSYWKLNLPRLGDEGQCIVCDNIKKIEEFRNKINPENGERITEWIRNWNCMNINNSVLNHGIEAVDKLSCSFETSSGKKIEIQNSTVLNLYIAETLCESYNNDLVYKYINYEKTDLNLYLRLQLICTQIILFGNQNSRQLQLSLLSEVIGLLAKADRCNSYTSLAGLVIISQEALVVYELLNEILFVNKSTKILKVREDMLQSQNEDLVLAIGYFLCSNYMIEQLLNGFVSRTREESSFINQLNELLLPSGELKLLFKEFEGLYVNEMGRKHNTNQQKLLSEHVTEFSDLKKRCNQVLNDVERLCELTKYFPVALVNSRGNANKSEYRIDELVMNLHVRLKEEVEEYENRVLKNENIEQFVVGESVRNAIKDCEKMFDEVICNYFISYSDQTELYFQKMVASFEKKYSKRIQLELTYDESVKGMHKYYYWNQSIEKELLYLLDNADHCEYPLDENDKESPVMKVKISFGFNEILITTSSWSEKLAEQVKNHFLQKNRLSKEQSIAFDVVFDFNNTKKTEDGLFFMESKMRVPACYQRLKGE